MVPMLFKTLINENMSVFSPIYDQSSVAMAWSTMPTACASSNPISSTWAAIRLRFEMKEKYQTIAFGTLVLQLL